MERNETVYSTLMWLDSSGSGQVMKPGGLPLLPDSTPNRVPTGVALGLAGNLTSVLQVLPITASGVKPTCLLNI